MPTALDNAMRSKNLLLAFGGAITAAAAWTIWGSDLFPAQEDAKGDPEGWTMEELRRWLEARELKPSAKSTRQELLRRVRANMRNPNPRR